MPFVTLADDNRIYYELTGPEDGFDGEGTRTNISTKIACAVDFYGAVDLMTYKSDRPRPDTNKPEMAMFNQTNTRLLKT